MTIVILSLSIAAGEAKPGARVPVPVEEGSGGEQWSAFIEIPRLSCSTYTASCVVRRRSRAKCSSARIRSPVHQPPSLSQHTQAYLSRSLLSSKICEIKPSSPEDRDQEGVGSLAATIAQPSERTAAAHEGLLCRRREVAPVTRSPAVKRERSGDASARAAAQQPVAPSRLSSHARLSDSKMSSQSVSRLSLV